LTKEDVKIVLGMAARGDRNHDIAAWFGVNQGRIAEAKSGEFGTLEAAPANELPPKGAPGVKGRRLRGAVEQAIETLRAGDTSKVLERLLVAASIYDAHED
jgi:hypothetical protein